ncbi:MAG: outer membrane beta-barrel protein [Bacteroidales bacterium]|nr:outer membrane beta-barrel protein [Bacteroidales bacterium]
MKKLFLTLALVFATLASANAQFGVIGGWTSSNAKVDGSWKPDTKSMSLYHLGVAYKIKMGPLFAAQPELSYQVKGAVLNDNISTLSTRGGYVELGLGMQLGVDLLVFRPFFLFEPFIGYQVYGSDDFQVFSYDANSFTEPVRSYLRDAKNKFEGGFGVGGGLELMNHFQITVQWFKNIGQLYDGGKFNDYADVLSGLKDVKNYSGVKITLGMFF